MYSSIDIVKAEQPKQKKKKYRVSTAATFEVMGRLMGWPDDVQLTGVTVDHRRQMVQYHFVGDSLKSVPNSECPEGQEAVEVTPPAWQSIMEFPNKKTLEFPAPAHPHAPEIKELN